ncbi:MAG: DUF1800 domain-containing protein [Rhodospirillaceae bacterium]|nr:DUF1800 domain-containing protein [Rhodospirillaceae bacterium]
MIVRFLLLIFCLIVGSGRAYAISFDDARHLLARTGFGTATPTEIDKILPLSYEAAVDSILDGVLDIARTPVPKFQSNPLERPTVKRLDKAAKKEFKKRNREDRKALKFWWIQEMLETPSPFTEHMVLFWHNHFVSEIRKVKFGQWAYEQNATFRKYAIGDFRKLLTEVSVGPAMLVYLDANKNKKGKPNENFAREVLELFTLGEGQGYTEKDIRESARAYTGWRVNFKAGGFIFKSRAHDDDEKTVLGESGNFDDLDVIKIILKQPRVSEFLAEKLWREFVSLEPNPSESIRLAQIIRDNDYDLKPMMKALFMSDGFRHPSNRGLLIKSPVELTIGTLRLLGLKPPEYKKVWNHQKRLGQNVFDPPDVKGWRGGTAWISSTTTLRRTQFLQAAFKGIRKFSKNTGSMAMNKGRRLFGSADPAPLQMREVTRPGYLKKLILAIEPVMQKKFVGKGPKVIRNLLLDPAYQVK